MAASGCLASGHLVRAARQPCTPRTAAAITRRPLQTACSLRPRASSIEGNAALARTAHTARHTADVEQPVPCSSYAAGAAAAALLASTLPGTAFAADQPAQEPQLPQLPTPPEVVRSLSESLLGGDGEQPAVEEAPPLKDGDTATTPSNGGGNGNGNGKDAAKNGKSNDKPSAEDAKRDGELETRFKSQILPKIQEQLKGLDQNEKPNAATIELKRQLRRAEDDIFRLLDDLKEKKSEAARAEASGLAREFEDIRSYVKQNGGELADEAGG